MSEEKPMNFLAIQNKFLSDLNYHINVAQTRSGYKHIGYSFLIKVLEKALEKAHELNVMEKERIAYEKEFGSSES